jgi:LEA14-like dessication related protein
MMKNEDQKVEWMFFVVFQQIKLQVSLKIYGRNYLEVPITDYFKKMHVNGVL